MESVVDLHELASRESERVEWKENVASIEDVVETITAFSNDYSNLGGGYVVCGARETKDEHGFQKVEMAGMTSARCKEVEGKVLACCRDQVDPPVVPVVSEIQTADPSRRILVFIVPATRRAHSFRRKGEGSPSYYVRIGRTTQKARNGIYRELLVRKGEVEPWDRRFKADLSPTDIDLISLREYLQRMDLWEPSRDVADYLSDTRSLSSFVPPLMSKDSLTKRLIPRNFAVLLFGSDPMRVSPGAYTVVSYYPGVDRSEPLAQKTEYTGSLIRQAERVLADLTAETGILFDKDNPRPNAPKYPRKALQEAVVNAIVHRDYELDQPIRITIFQDRIEILSPGSLPTAVPLESFLAGKAAPFWRNQTLSYFFNKLQLAQAEGQGIPTIFRSMRSEGCPDPRFEVAPLHVVTILPAHPRHMEFLRKDADSGNPAKSVAAKPPRRSRKRNGQSGG